MKEVVVQKFKVFLLFFSSFFLAVQFGYKNNEINVVFFYFIKKQQQKCIQRRRIYVLVVVFVVDDDGNIEMKRNDYNLRYYLGLGIVCVFVNWLCLFVFLHCIEQENNKKKSKITLMS